MYGHGHECAIVMSRHQRVAADRQRSVDKSTPATTRWQHLASNSPLAKTCRRHYSHLLAND
jgi:hypothetical protein